MRLILLFILFTQWCFAQRIEFADALTGLSIENVELYCIKGGITIKSNNGTTSISNYPNEHEFKTIVNGYEELEFTRKSIRATSNVIFLQPNINTLDEVIVSHSKWKEKRIDIPKRTTSLNSANIFKKQAQTAADVVGKGNQVFVQKSQSGGGSPIIRGYSTNRILLTVDGVRMNNAIFRSGNVQNIISIDPFIIEQSEVILGPGSVVYGSDAIGGVINFSTLDPKFKKKSPPGSFTQRFSSANRESTSHLNYSFGNKKWKNTSSFTYSRFGDLTQGKNGPNDFLRKSFVQRLHGEDLVIKNNNPRKQVNTDYQQYHLFNKLSLIANKNHHLKFTSIYSETSNYDRYDRLQIINDDKTFKFSEWFYGPQKWLFLNASSNYRINHKLFDELKTSLAFQFFEESRNQRPFGNNFRINNTETVNVYSLNIDAIKRLKKTSLSYGIELIHNKVNSTANRKNIITNETFNDISFRYPDGSIWNSVAFYSSLNHNFNKNNKLTAGLRYNYVSLNADFIDPVLQFPFENVNLNNSAINGNLGLVTKLSKKWNSSIFLSTAFRAPNIDDIGKIFQSSEPGTLVVPNPDLKPETAYNIEANIVYHTQKTNITFSPYFTFLDNALSRNNFSFNGLNTIEFQGIDSEITAIQNSNSQRIYGVDISGRFQISNAITTDFNYHFIRGEEKIPSGKNVPVRHVTPNFGKISVHYRKNRFEISPYVEFSESLKHQNLNPREQNKTNIFPLNNNGLTYSPSWYTINIQSLFLATKKLKVSLNLENLTNQRYRTYSSGISAPGFNIITAIQVKF